MHGDAPEHRFKLYEHEKRPRRIYNRQWMRRKRRDERLVQDLIAILGKLVEQK